MVTQEIINDTMTRICGGDYSELTYGMRREKVIAHADKLGWFLCHTGQGFALSKEMESRGKHIIIRDSLREIVESILEIESGLYDHVN
jgi:hypothetical protein